MEFLRELWQFMRERKKFWLLPLLLILVLISLVMVTTTGSVLGPFIYSLF